MSNSWQPGEDPTSFHEVAISSFPNWTPGRRLRQVRFVGEDLELATDPMARGESRIRPMLRGTGATGTRLTGLHRARPVR